MTEAEEKRREMVEIIDEFYIPKSKILTRIKELERDRDREHDWVVDRVQSELKGLLKK